MNSFKIVPLILIASAVWGCQADSARDQINSQYSADYSAKALELQDAVGIWSGTMHLISYSRPFDCVVTLGIVPQIEKSPQSESPSETARIATLGGNIAFPALAHLKPEDEEGLAPLLAPLNWISHVDLSYGDYGRSDHTFALPYLDSKHESTFGHFSGTIDGDQMTGTWSANDFGDVGTFVLNRQAQSTPAHSGGRHR